MRTERYRMHSSIKPYTNGAMILTHKKTGRKFKFENSRGFVCYECDMIDCETNKKVATIHYEDYYKD